MPEGNSTTSPLFGPFPSRGNNSTYVMPTSPEFPPFHGFKLPSERQPGEHTSEMNDSSLLKLRLLLADSSVEQDHRYAMIPMPSTYEDAQSAAALVFGSYMPRDADVTEIKLRFSIKNREGEWCWADILPRDWKITMKTLSTEEVGVFYTTGKPSEKSIGIAMSDFTVGKVGLIVGERIVTGINWKYSSNNPRSLADIADTMVDRPSSYEEAVTTITGIGSEGGYLSTHIKQAVKNLGNKRLKFYYFTSIQEPSGLPVPAWWKEFPEEAYHDEDVWRIMVPEAEKLLGFTIEKDNHLDPEKGKKNLN